MKMGATSTPSAAVFSIIQDTQHHFSDYGFDSQIDYFQEPRRQLHHRRDSSSSFQHFKLQKPISKDTHTHTYKKRKKTTSTTTTSSTNKKRRGWWKSALIYLKSKWPYNHTTTTTTNNKYNVGVQQTPQPPYYLTTSMSGPIYTTDSLLDGSTTPFRSTSGPISGAPKRKGGDVDTPYFCLSELNAFEELQSHHRAVTSPMPIYLVT